MLGTLRTGLARHQRGGSALAALAAQPAQGHGMEAEGGDLAIGQRQHLGQLGDEYPLRPLIVARVGGDQVSVQKDAALIVNRNDLPSRSERADG